jgi:hypothetical protein
MDPPRQTSHHPIRRSMMQDYEAIITGQREKLEAQFVENVGKLLGAKVVIEGIPQ